MKSYKMYVKSIVFRFPKTAIPGEQEIAASKKTPEVAKLGTILGVYLPCIQVLIG